MAYVYLSDGEPESEDYETNYFYYDGSNPKMVARINEVLERSNAADLLVRNKLYELCEVRQTYRYNSTDPITNLCSN